MEQQAGSIGDRYVALDSLRGLCAIAVVLFHFRTTGAVSNLAFIRNSWMFVDFFFVLSGFVIAAAYGRRLSDGAVPIRRFMWLRLGRVYPLHVAVILAMIVLELLLVVLDLSSFTGRAAFSGNRSLEALAENLLLLNAFGVSDRLTWNGPSWSIAAELWAYLLFAVVFAFGGKARWAILWSLGGAAALWLAATSPGGLNVTYDLGFVRCVYGFALGTLVFRIVSSGGIGGGTRAEMLVAAITVLFVSFVAAGKATLLAPLFLALPVLVLAKGEGILSRALTTRGFAWLGTISYSVYMVHGFVLARVGDVVQLAGGMMGLSHLPPDARGDFPTETITGPAAMLDLLTFVTVAVVIGVATVTYLWIERPCREWSRRSHIGQRMPLPASAADLP